MRRDDLRSLIGLALACWTVVVLSAAWPRPIAMEVRAGISAPEIVFDQSGGVQFISPPDARVRYTVDGSVPSASSFAGDGSFQAPSTKSMDALLAIPTSVQWRHPVGGFPQGMVVRACVVDESGRAGAVATRSFLTGTHGKLPVLSLSLPPEALFDPDTGIYVIGHAIFHAAEDFVQRYPRDQKWWKYPGNFHFRGAHAERTAHLELFSAGHLANAPPEWSADVHVRINGNNTRGFPQHALRVIFDRSLEQPLFGEEQGSGFKRVLLRTAGNDQDHAFFRDALQHRLCAGLPFETSACVQSVLYVNGAYWGLHNLRERLDEKELARRHGLKAKDITIIEDRIALYEGNEEELKRFSRFLTMTEHWDATWHSFVDSLERHMDVDGFLTYMAAQIILSNTDWPEQNVKWWRFTGTPDTLPGPRDGRWHFIMGDSDMGMGLATDANYDMFVHIDQHPNAPVARLLKACLRSRELTARFNGILASLLDGPLSEQRMIAELVRMCDAIAAEMPTHIRRWRRPRTMEAWERDVAELYTFASLRATTVRAQAGAWSARYPLP